MEDLFKAAFGLLLDAYGFPATLDFGDSTSEIVRSTPLFSSKLARTQDNAAHVTESANVMVSAPAGSSKKIIPGSTRITVCGREFAIKTVSPACVSGNIPAAYELEIER